VLPYIPAVVVVGDAAAVLVAVVDTATVAVHVADAGHVPCAAYVPSQDTHNAHPDIDEDSSCASFLQANKRNIVRNNKKYEKQSTATPAVNTSIWHAKNNKHVPGCPTMGAC
jgi:hypothetical protein